MSLETTAQPQDTSLSLTCPAEVSLSMHVIFQQLKKPFSVSLNFGLQIFFCTNSYSPYAINSSKENRFADPGFVVNRF